MTFTDHNSFYSCLVHRLWEIISPGKTNEKLPSDLFISMDIGNKFDTGHQERRGVSDIACDPHPPDLTTLSALTNTVPAHSGC